MPTVFVDKNSALLISNLAYFNLLIEKKGKKMGYVSNARVIKNPKKFTKDFLKNINLGERFLSIRKVYTKISDNDFLSYDKKYFC